MDLLAKAMKAAHRDWFGSELGETPEEQQPEVDRTQQTSPQQVDDET